MLILESRYDDNNNSKILLLIRRIHLFQDSMIEVTRCQLIKDPFKEMITSQQ